MKIIYIEGSDVYLTPEGKLPEYRDDRTPAWPSDEGFRFEEYLAVSAGVADTGELEKTNIRQSWNILSQEDYSAVAKGEELVYWNDISRHCSACGGRMHREGPISKRCESCGRELFPHVSPCVIVLVRMGDRALLVRSRSFRRDFYGLVAGFVETGESLEECLRREVREETSLEIDNIRYFGSQTWPFPSQLMIGFTADYAGGDISFADDELCAGEFFSRDNLPNLPSYPSIARRLIDGWIDSAE